MGMVDSKHAIIGKQLRIKTSRVEDYSSRVWTVTHVSSKENTIKNFRNIGISAHVDAGKTLLTENILELTRRVIYSKEVT